MLCERVSGGTEVVLGSYVGFCDVFVFMVFGTSIFSVGSGFYRGVIVGVGVVRGDGTRARRLAYFGRVTCVSPTITFTGQTIAFLICQYFVSYVFYIICVCGSFFNGGIAIPYISTQRGAVGGICSPTCSFGGISQYTRTRGVS